MSASNAPPLEPDMSTKRIKQYIELKEQWETECRDHIGPETEAYETFAGRAGDAMRKRAQRIANGFMTEFEELAMEAKLKGYEAFGNQDYEGANTHHQNALQHGLPHNVECWYNIAGTLLKLGRYEEAESVAKNSLREHAAIHGHHYGRFHFHVYSLISEAIQRRALFKRQLDYCRRKLKIAPYDTELKEIEVLLQFKTEQFQKALSIAPQRIVLQYYCSSGQNLGVCLEQWEVFAGAGAFPWDENARDLIVVATGATGAQSAYHPSKDELEAVEKYAGEDLGNVPCAYCNGCPRPPLCVPILCRGCGQEPYCTEICAVQHWGVHKRSCGSVQTQSVPNSTRLLPSQRNIALISGLIMQFMLHNAKIIEEACTYALDLSNNPTAFEEYAIVIDFKYKPNPVNPLKALDIRKVSWDELRQDYPQTYDSWKKTNAAVKAGGHVGTVATMGLDGKWESSSSRMLLVPKELIGMPGPAAPHDWKESLLYKLNNSDQ